VTLTSPAASPIAFTAMFGSRINRLVWLGPGQIALVSDRDGIASIYVMGADGASPVRLAPAGDPSFSPTWSPDGAQIAFGRCCIAQAGLFVMAADGSGVRQVGAPSVTALDPAWSPDGRQLAYSERHGTSREIDRINLDGTNAVTLTNAAGDDRSPAWSPDGRRIVFSSERTGNLDIFVMNADGSNQAALTSHVRADSDPSWSPAGDRVVFVSDRAGNADIWVMNADGSGQTQLTTDAAADGAPVWRSDGRRILFQSRRDGNAEIYGMNPDGSEQTNLTNDPDFDGQPASSPAPAVRRALIGPVGSDLGANPPFGAQRVVAVVGLTGNGLASAATLTIPAAAETSVNVEAVPGIGTNLAGCRVTAAGITDVREDTGRGLVPIIWGLPSSAGPTTAVLLFFDGATGRLATVLAVGNSVAATPLSSGDRLTFHGDFPWAASLGQGGGRTTFGRSHEVTLSASSGVVVAAR
jgi:dipeptidyl aminopeptidase/acylaminoacyl peptidase